MQRRFQMCVPVRDNLSQTRKEFINICSKEQFNTCTRNNEDKNCQADKSIM